MGLYDVRGEKFIFHKDFLVHNAQNRLMFNKNTRYPLMSMFRVRKYVDRGYTISKNEYLRMMLRCMTLEINSYDELADQIGGMYGLQLDLVMDTSIPFDLLTVIDQISEVINDFDSERNAIRYDKDAHYRNIDNALFHHRLLRTDKTLTKITYNEITILLEEGILYEVAAYKDSLFDTIPNYEGTKIRAYGKTILKENGDVNVQTIQSYKTKLLTEFFEDNENIVELYSEEFIGEEIGKKSKYMAALFEFDIKDIVNSDNLISFSPLHSDNLIKVKNTIYKDSLDIEGPEKVKLVAKTREEKDIILKKYNERIYKMSNRTRLEKIKNEKLEKSFVIKLKEKKSTSELSSTGLDGILKKMN